jgi:hypothetical protein
VRWYQLAANQGHAGAQYNLAVCLANGKGGVQDKSEAKRWHALAADPELARPLKHNQERPWYEHGAHDLTNDAGDEWSQAIRLLRVAANCGVARAQNNRGAWD